ncbi:MAG: hypothetical protein J5521_08950, partial [Lachnospiraceae bacterium]|nr:hypothetical protein [Lachnospiraceae bacterium]
LTDSTFILSRTWQGKSMFCSLGIPVAILLLLMIGECRGKNNILFGAATILAISCIAMTPASIYLLTLFFMTGCICVAVAVKKASVVIKALPMALSMAIIACLYMIYLN